MASKSLNQIRAEILAFTSAHGQLNTALYATRANLAVIEDKQYPLFIFALSNARKDKAELVLDFKGQILDLIHTEQDNEVDVESDTLLIACDILGFLDSDDRGYTLVQGASCVPMVAATHEDNAGGYLMSWTLRVPFPFDRCIIPIKDGMSIATESGEKITTE